MGFPKNHAPPPQRVIEQKKPNSFFTKMVNTYIVPLVITQLEGKPVTIKDDIIYNKGYIFYKGFDKCITGPLLSSQQFYFVTSDLIKISLFCKLFCNFFQFKIFYPGGREQTAV